jgi:hypothetical protein
VLVHAAARRAGTRLARAPGAGFLVGRRAPLGALEAEADLAVVGVVAQDVDVDLMCCLVNFILVI